MPPKVVSAKIKVDSPTVRIQKEILIQYGLLAKEFGTVICNTVREPLLECIENDALLKVFVVDPKDRKKMIYMTDAEFANWLQTRDKKSAKKKKRRKVRKDRSEPKKPLVRILPLLEALRNTRYTQIQKLCVYDVLVDHSDMMCLAAMLEKGVYNIEVIELINCFMFYKSFEILMPSVKFTRSLTRLVFDFNEFGDRGCVEICRGLADSQWITSLSMCYCDLHKPSGKWLGEMLATTAVREICLDGNKLEAEGVIDMLYPISEAANVERLARLELKRQQEEAKAFASRRYHLELEENQSAIETNIDNNITGKDGKVKIKKRKPPPVGPQLNVLRIAENLIDQIGPGKQFAPVRAMQIIKEIIAGSKDIKEIDLDNNDIGDVGGRMLLDGLLDRADSGLPKMYLRVGHVVHQDTFEIIQKLAPEPRRKQ